MQGEGLAGVYAGIFWDAPKPMPEICAGINVFGQKEKGLELSLIPRYRVAM